jgi:hypothetical protein
MMIIQVRVDGIWRGKPHAHARKVYLERDSQDAISDAVARELARSQADGMVDATAKAEAIFKEGFCACCGSRKETLTRICD